MSRPQKDLQAFRDAWRDELTRKTCEEDTDQVNSTSMVPSADHTTLGIKDVKINMSENESPFAFQVADGLLRDWNCNPGGSLTVPQTKRSLSENKTNSDPVRKKLRKSLVDIFLDDLNDLNEIPFFEISLPRELAVQIFQYLDMNELCRCAQVSKLWKSISEDNQLWKRIYKYYRNSISSQSAELEQSENWKSTVRELKQQNLQLQKNWKEHKCQVTYFHHARGGILTCVNSHDDVIIAGYTNGQVKLWDIKTQETDLLESCSNSLELIAIDNEESVGLSENYVTSVHINKSHLVSGYNHGQVQVWNRNSSTNHGSAKSYQLPGHQVNDVMSNQSAVYVHSINTNNKSIQLQVLDITTEALNPLDIISLRPPAETFSLPKKVMIPSSLSSNSLIYSSRDSIHHHTILTDHMTDRKTVNQSVIEQFYATHFTCLHPGVNQLLVGLTSNLGISAEYKIRCYSNGEYKHVYDLRGHTSQITALNDDQYGHVICSGCHDRRVRVYDSRICGYHSALHTLQGHHGPINSIQIDDWKIVSGDSEGFFCMWDLRMANKLWESQSRHPVRYLNFSTDHLIVANIPDYDRWIDKDTDHMTHIRYRGRIQANDFSKDQSTIGIPSICSSLYDTPEASTYNLSLITPYDSI